MSCCWNCQKKDACEKLYLNGEQQTCQDKERAYESFEKYVSWLAKARDYTDVGDYR